MVIPAQKTVLLNGKNITYREQGAGPAMLFLHGLAGNSRSWQKQFETFSKTHRVIAWDAPGFGGSDGVGADVDIFAHTLLGLLDQIGVENLNLTGHSMGGIVAGRLAGLYPARIKALILSCTFWGGALPKGSPLGTGYQARIDSLKTLPAKTYGRERAAAMLAPGASPDVIELAADIASETRPDGLASAAQMLQETDNRAYLTELKIPTTVLSGENDPVISSETSDIMADLIPGAKAVAITGAGHAPYLEHPEAYNNAVRHAFRLES